MAYSPDPMKRIFTFVRERYPDQQLGGIYANKPGYHNSRNGNKALGRPNDYSMGGAGQPPADRRGSSDAAAALDLTPKKAETHHEITKRMLAILPRDDDPRAWPIREFFGSLDGHGVDGYSRWLGQRITSDLSHEWHGHWSIYREFVDDADAMLGVAELICGIPLAQSQTKHRPPASKPPVVVKPAPAPAEQPPVVKPPVVVKPPAVDSEQRFTKVAFLNLPGVGNWQGASLAGHDWYVVEARKQSDGSEDAYVYRIPNKVDADNLKPAEAPMRLNAAPGTKVHPTGWGVSDSGVVWLTWNDKPEGNDVVTVQYRAGRTVTKADCQEMHVFSEGNVQIAFDQTNDVCSTRVVTTKYETHYLRTKQDVLDGKDRPLGVAKIPRRANRVVQGFTVAKNDGGNWELRVLVGLKSKGSPFGIERWSFVTGKLIETISIPETLGREPEGIDGNTFGMKTEDRSGLDVYRYTV